MDSASSIILQQHIREHSPKLIGANIRLAKEWGIGSEKRWHMDQATGKLKLFLSEDVILEWNFQIILTYDRKAKTFMWAANNPSIDPKLQELVQRYWYYGVMNNITLLTLTTPFEMGSETHGVLSIGFHSNELQGLFRAENPSSYVYLGTTGTPRLINAKGKNLEKSKVFTGLTEINEADAIAWVKAYYQKIADIDFQFAKELPKVKGDDDKEEQLSDRLLSEKTKIFKQYWETKSETWLPTSFKLYADKPIVPDFFIGASLGPRLFVIQSPGSGLEMDVYVVEKTKKGLRIIDQDLDWGANLLWP